MTIQAKPSSSISYDSTTYGTAPGLDIKEFQIIEDWNGRPASAWSVQRIGLLQSKIERYTYNIYHNNKYGKHNLSKLIPGHALIQFANETFGYDGWRMDVIDVEARECQPFTAVNNGENTNTSGVKYTVVAEAQVKVTLKDGTNTQCGGLGRITLSSRGECYNRSKKEAVGDALKKALLSFEKIILDYETKITNNYYVDGLYGSKKIKNEANTNYNLLSATNSKPTFIKLEDAKGTHIK
ncbi:AMP_1a_G0006910.mRNA.1.CDS.1 [Saccharomyces cerevisiae]|nr:Rad59p [Saccharomyces cerevisiae YJM689]CAI4327650.1 AMP_1a_G0006910.mRNA.1.CDS.1 [Saccharomyces cerevisiae]CAI6549704.1 AMP_1a_G0006910.mRNA.1.CDS.1 [Saccharomyces cerevisiae]